MSSATSSSEPFMLVEPTHEYKPRFEEERLGIAIALKRAAGAIEHIGSTAIPAIKGKATIDILVGLRALPLSAAVAPLVELGYEYVEGAGNEERLFFRRPQRTHHVHVVLHDGMEWRRHVIFRDWLNLHPEMAKEYEALKEDLAKRFAADRVAYAEGKSAFVARVLDAAGKFPALRLGR